jgi:hypothetical protein
MASHEDSLIRRIAAFYRRNPDEWLSYEDMAIKFNCTRTQAQAACTNLTERYGMARETMHIVRMVVGGEKADA